jgi:pilus assembly protein CpaE
VLYGTKVEVPEYREVLRTIGNLKLVEESVDPETFWKRQQERSSDLILVHLDGKDAVPDWLDPLITHLPNTEVLVSSNCRDVDFLLNIMKLRPGGFLPLPLNREELMAAVERVKSRLGKEHDLGKSQMVVVSGTKGGVGTTSIATNLAVALAKTTPGGVILVDLARPFPHVGQFLDLKCDHSIKDLVAGADALDPLFLEKIVRKHKTNLDVLLSYPNPVNQAPPDFRAMSKIFAALRTSYQWVVVDLGSWVDSFYLQVLQKADQILLVTELTLPDLQNFKVIISIFLEHGLDVQKVKILVNHYAKHYALGLNNLESNLKGAAIYTLPHEYHSLMEAINLGEPLSEAAPRSKLWRKIREIAAELVAQNQPESERQLAIGAGLFQKIFSR